MGIPWYELVAAVLLDFLVGDPPRFPHPVRAIGSLAAGLEKLCRRLITSPGAAGAVTWFVTLAVCGGVACLLLFLAGLVHPVAETCLRIYLLYSCIATRDLVAHSGRVKRALEKEGLAAGRLAVSRLVSRRTEKLGNEEVIRAAVESVAENLSDATLAPLFYACLGGPLGALLYRCINTMDAMFGYKNSLYLRFGFIPAKADDLVNFLPARLSVLFICLGALLLRRHPLRALKTACRDGHKHDSPNSGYPEAAVAGALGVRLGGASDYFGKIVYKPELGEALTPLVTKHIRQANQIVTAAVICFTLLAALFFLLPGIS